MWIIGTMKNAQQIRPLPFPIYYWAVALIALAGFLDAAYLAISHIRVYTDMGYKSFCAVSKSINCDTVSQSPFSILLDVPVPVWGMAGYAMFLVLLFAARHGSTNQARLWPTLFVMAVCFSVYSIILALISTFYIHSYCIMCIASYAVNFMLLFYTWLVHRRFANQSMAAGIKNDFQWMIHQGRTAGGIFMAVSLVIIGSLVLWTPHYWEMSSRSEEYQLAHGVTSDGHPELPG